MVLQRRRKAKLQRGKPTTAALPQSGEAGGGRRVREDLFVLCEKFRGAGCKLKIATNLGLKRESVQYESSSVFQDLQLLCCANLH